MYLKLSANFFALLFQGAAFEKERCLTLEQCLVPEVLIGDCARSGQPPGGNNGDDDLAGFEESQLLQDMTADDLFGDMDEMDGSTQSLPSTANISTQASPSGNAASSDKDDSLSDIPSIDQSHDDVPPPSVEHIDCLKKYFGHSSFRPYVSTCAGLVPEMCTMCSVVSEKQ